MLLRSSRGRAALVASLGVTMGVASGAPPAHAASPTAGAITGERLKLPSGPSSVRGLAEEPTVVPFYGQIGYSVPIELPSGLGKLAPSLAFTYSGALGNGALGIGWTMPGARIERSQRLGQPSFTAADELELSGPASGRLVAISATEYRLEGMGQTVRVRKVGDGFEVDLGTGVKMKFGTVAAARQEGSLAGGPLRTTAWLLEEETNLAGERITYTYQQDQGQVYLSRIAWGPGQIYSADLTYVARPDATTSYREGFRVVTARRLDRIRVNAFSVERRAYQLHYSNAFSVSRLAQVTSTGRAGAGSWPALTFDYATPVAPAVTPMPGVGTWRLNANGITLVDLDGDGASELLQLADGGHSYRVNQNGSFGASLPLGGNTQSITSLQLQDVDGDARADLLQDTGTGWAVWKWTKPQWVLQSLPGGVWPGSNGLALKNPSSTRFSDLNGDGLVDAIKWDNDNLKIHQGTRTGMLAAREVPRIGGSVLPTATGRFQDENGDGLDDYLVVQADRIDVYLGRGDGTFDPVVTRAYPFAGTVGSPADIHLVDLDRDDLLDLVRVDLGTVRWFRGKAGGAFETTAITVNNPESLAADVVVTIADTNGNGSQDVVWSSATNMWSMDLVGPTTAGMLVRTRNGIGLDVSFAYRSAHAISVDARLANDPWLHEVPLAMPVPVRKVTALGAGETTRQIDYLVRDGYWDAVERRFGGFLGTFVTTWGATPAQTSTVQTRYHNGAGANRNLRGKALVEQVRNGSGVRLSMTVNTWEAMLVSGLPDTPLTRKAVLRESRTRYEDVTPIRESRITYEYDTLGRAIRAVDHGRLDMTGDDSIQVTRYADDDTTWVRDVQCEDRLTDLAGTVVSHKQTYFGDETTIHPLCVVGKGWTREQKSWLAQESRWITHEHNTFDARGNVLTETKGGVVRTMTYDATGLFPISESATVGGDTLAWTLTWDQVLGVATELTDPNGHKTKARYDALGRTIGFSVGTRPDHMVIQYDWTGTFPKTTLFEFDGPVAELGALPATWSPTGKWRHTVDVSNGKGEVRYRAKRLGSASWIISDYRERDPAGRVVFTGQPVFASSIELAARPAGIVGQTLTYDPLGRLIEQRLPTGSKRTYTHGSFERTTQEDNQARVRHVLDGKGRIVRTERPLPGGGLQSVDATYDAAGNLTQMSLQGGAVIRQFTYNSLGRLTGTSDPDAGINTLSYDDAGRILEEKNGLNQTVTYAYDALGRLATRTAGTAVYRYRYDTARGGVTLPSGTGGLRSRLASVEEPTGFVDFGYDDAGRAVWTRRIIDGKSASETLTHAPSGQVLQRQFDDGLILSHGYDVTGRLTSIGDLWRIVNQDASGRIIEERFKNGVVSRYERDSLGMASRVQIQNGAGAGLYDVAITRNIWSGIDTVTDNDATGLDHSATFTYDDLTRLTAATVGRNANRYSFSYSYDGLQNMIARSATGPTTLGALTGTYRYAEGGKGPRQLTSVLAAGGGVTSFNYDSAGRQTSKGAATMQYDALDQLLSVTGLPGGDVTHAYGYDGVRLKTVSPQGTTYFFSSVLSERGGVREHDVVVGDRVVARVAYQTTGAAAGALRDDDESTAGAVLGAVMPIAPLGLGLVFFAWAFVGTGARSRRVRAFAAATATFVLVGGCGLGSSSLFGTKESLAWTLQQEIFLHTGIGAGPAVFTDSAGRLLEERRYEPFGEEIDASIRQTAGNHVVGAPDLGARDLNSLNKRTDVTSGWSYHGARWMAPETARWLTVDPPTRTPGGDQLKSPWGLHPYQYVDQNPVRFWDPDGHNKVLLFVGMGDDADFEVQGLTSQVGSNGTLMSVTPDDGKSSSYVHAGTTYNLSTTKDREAFARAVTPSAPAGTADPAKFEAQRTKDIAAILKSSDRRTRNEMAEIISIYSKAHSGAFTIERVVLSGHHYPSTADEVYGDNGHQIKLSHMAKLAKVYPDAVKDVKHMAYSACTSLVDSQNIKTTKGMFPNLETMWGYGGSQPWSPKSTNGAVPHLQIWEKSTAAPGAKLTGKEASHLTHTGQGNIRVHNF